MLIYHFVANNQLECDIYTKVFIDNLKGKVAHEYCDVLMIAHACFRGLIRVLNFGI